jgi:hypothetical protein
MNHIEITGKSRYIGLEGGFWAIETDKGDKYTPINMPEQLKTEGATVRVRAKILKGAVSISMYGEAIRIISFETLAVV